MICQGRPQCPGNLQPETTGMKQSSSASAEWVGKKRQTRRERFLAEMTTRSSGRVEALSEPHYPRTGKVD